jgi:hypothetical protein
MKKIVNHFKSKPEHVRRSVAGIAAFAVTAIIFIIWMWLLYHRLSSPEVKAAIANDLKPISVIRDDISSSYQSASSGLGNVNK